MIHRQVTLIPMIQDAARFEVYVGGQRAPHDRGRFAHLSAARYSSYPMALEASWTLAELPTRREFIAVLGEN